MRESWIALATLFDRPHELAVQLVPGIAQRVGILLPGQLRLWNLNPKILDDLLEVLLCDEVAEDAREPAGTSVGIA